jgi:hypothetical protein
LTINLFPEANTRYLPGEHRTAVAFFPFSRRAAKHRVPFLNPESLIFETLLLVAALMDALAILRISSLRVIGSLLGDIPLI